MATVISIALQKGGTGKTTTAQALASTLGSMNRRVLLVDMDSQSNCTSASGAEEITHTTTDVMFGDSTATEAITHCSLYDLIPSDGDLIVIDEDKSFAADILDSTLKPLAKEYDFIIIDTPPALGNLLKNSLYASDYVIIPLDARAFAVNGLTDLQSTLEAVGAAQGRLKVLGVLLIKYSDRTVLNKRLRSLTEERAAALGTTVFNTTIREGIAVAEAQAFSRSLIEYAPKSKPCLDYIEFTKEVIRRIEDDK